MSGRGSHSDLPLIFYRIFLSDDSQKGFIYHYLMMRSVYYVHYSNGCKAAPVAVLCIQPLVLRTSPLLHYYYYYYLLQARHYLLVKLLSSHNYELTPTELKSIAKYRLIACNNDVSASLLKRN